MSSLITGSRKKSPEATKNRQQSSSVSSVTSNGTEWLSKAAVAFEEQAKSVLTSISSSLGVQRSSPDEKASHKDSPVKTTVVTWKNQLSPGSLNKQQQGPAMVVHPSHDGAEVTLADCSYPSSFLTFDTQVEETKTRCLKILRGANLSTSANPFCQVLVDGVPIGETPVREQTDNPIFGGPQSTFRVEGNQTTKIAIQVWDSSAEAPKQLGWVEFTVEQVLCQDSLSNPNLWLYLQPNPTSSAVSDNSSRDFAPRLQIRLIPAVQFSPLQPQPSTKCLQAGPELPPIGSFAVRKLILQSKAPVTLHVYDVSNNQKVQDINYYTKAVGAGGIFHASVEIHGREYSFGGSRQPHVPGIFGCPPKRCVFHHYRESIYLGDCELSPEQVKLILKQLEPEWMAQSYNLFHKNCTTFSREFAIELGVGTIPMWVYSLGETAEPYLEPYLEYAKNRAKQESGRNATTQSKPPAVEEENLREEIVDHVMAARVQRSFRAKMAVSRKSVIIK